MKVQDLFMGFALVAVISAAPIEDKAVYDEGKGLFKAEIY